MTQAIDPTLPPLPHRGLGEAVHRLRGKWFAILAFGVLLMLLGVASLAFAFASTVVMVTLNGVFFLVAGAAEIGVGMHARGWSRFFLWVLGGFVYILVGLVCIVYPLYASAVITLMLGAGLIAAGVVRAYLAFHLPPGSRSAVLLAAAITFGLGLVIVVQWPLSAIYVLGTLLGVDLLFHGAGWASFGLALRVRR